jgi:hypothetical protein
MGAAEADDADIGTDDDGGGVRFIDDGENVPSQAGFGAKIGALDEVLGGGWSVCSAADAGLDNALNPALPTIAAAEEISRRRRFRLMAAASVVVRRARDASGRRAMIPKVGRAAVVPVSRGTRGERDAIVSRTAAAP